MPFYGTMLFGMNGKLFLIVGPSGSGKSSVLSELKKACAEYVYPLSATTRPMRRGEKDGDIYHFYTRQRFEDGIRNGEFLEHAVVHKDHCYGTLKAPILKALEDGKTLVREVDIQGFDSIRKAIPRKNLVTIFIAAPTKEELIVRIKERAPISPEELKKRVASMHGEYARARDCDYLVENRQGELQKTVQKVAAIIEEERKNH